MKGFYGKNNDLGKMARIFKYTAEGGYSAVLVSGPAGSGKTALVSRFVLDAEKEGALFGCAKADPLFSNSPFSTLSAALNMLAKKAIAEDLHGRSGMKDAILQGLHPDSDFIPLLNLVPSLSHILGKAVNLGGPGKKGPSLNFQFISLLEAFAAPGRPLILFLDDLQWMDGASHSFLHYLAFNGMVPGIMLVAAFRIRETEKRECLDQTVSLYQGRESTLCLNLSGLTKRDTRGFLRQWLDTVQDLNPLADVCHEKTGGNPLYLVQLLDDLMEKKVICRKTGEWVYDLSYIASLGVTDNIIDLIIERMRLLEKDSLVLLKQAACIQSGITLPLLEATSGFPMEKIAALLWKPVQMGLLQKKEESYAFAHDRIKETLEALLRDEDEIRGIHQRIVGFILAQGADMEKRVFTLLYHYDVYAHAITDPQLKQKMAGYYFMAGYQARNRSDYALALDYFTRGRAHVSGDIWTMDYGLALKFCNQIAECAYLAGDFSLADQMFKEAEERAFTFSHRLAVEMVKIPCYHAREKGEDAIGAGRAILDHLGFRMPQTPSKSRILYAVLKAWFRFVFSRKDRLRRKKMAPGTDVYQAFKCLNALGAVAYYVSPDKLLPLVAAAAFNLTLKHGNMEETPVTYIVFGIMLNQITGTAKWGRRLGGMARRISRNFNDDRLKTKEITLYNTTLEHWDKSMAQSIRDFEDGARFCLRQGDHEYFAYNALGGLHAMFISTTPLDEIRRKIDARIKVFQRLNHRFALTSAGVIKQAVVNLEQGADLPWILMGDHCDETRMEEGLHCTLTDLYYYKFCIAVYCGRMDAAAEIRKKLGSHVDIAMDTYVYYYYHFLSGLVDISLETGPKPIKAHLKGLKKYAAYNPAVYGSKYLLALGISLCLRGDPRAGAVLLEAGASARENGFLFEQALASEYLGRIAREEGDEAGAAKDIAQAVRLYQKWGLKWKQGLFGQDPGRQKIPQSLDLPRDSIVTGGAKPIPIEDILVAMKAWSGAGAIHLAHQAGECWKSRIHMDGYEIHRPLTFVPLPEKLLSYARATGEVIQADAGSIEAAFLDTDYYWAHKPTSFLVIPGPHLNAIYMENYNTIPDLEAMIRWARQSLDGMGPDPADPVPGPATLPALDLQLKARCCSIQEYMADNQAYRDPALTLAGLAQAVGLPRRTVTEAINTCLGQNFATFVNTYRVEAVKEAFGDPANQDATVLEIAYSQGFSSKSTFNTVFKKMVGTTPSKFRGGSDKGA